MKTIDFGTHGEQASVNGAGAAYGCPQVSVQVVLTGGEACIRIQLCLDPEEAEAFGHALLEEAVRSRDPKENGHNGARR